LDEKWTESDEVEQNNWAQKKIVFWKFEDSVGELAEKKNI
jgi:hypothetical protein